MANKIVLALAALLVIAVTAEALKCYNCGYADGTVPDGWEIVGSEDSCKSGKKPNDKFSFDCADMEYFAVSEGKFIGVPKTSGLIPKNAVNVSPLQASNNTAFSCAKMTMDGKLRGTDNNLKGTIRGCIMLLNTTQQLPDKCYANENSKIVADIKEQALIDIIGGYQVLFTDDSDAGVCSCSTDDCNGAINSVNISGFVLFASTFLAYFSKYM